ncbi:MAG: S41 family peptidase [Flavobacteriales bacterium]|nr:S41 family peptidase [Flavobacteriales bacterium]
MKRAFILFLYIILTASAVENLHAQEIFKEEHPILKKDKSEPKQTRSTKEKEEVEPEISLNLALDKISKTVMLIEKFYVDSTDAGKIVDDGIRAMLKKLDPHSTYIHRKDLQQTNEPLLGSFEGIGIQFQIMDDTITVVSPITGGPSEKLGIRSGDKIIEIEKEVVAGTGVTNKDVMRLLKGPKGTLVNVGIYRKGMDGLLDFPIIRDKIPMYSMDAAYKVNDKVGYIKINRFSRTTMEEFRGAISDLKKEGVEHLILDLRNNGGGYLRTAIELGDEFLAENKMIVYTDGVYSPRQNHKATLKGNFETGRLVILIDEGSASASEIVSGAVQDWDRGVIIGRRSFGKGLVQKPFSLPDGSAIRLTTARYYTPTGRCIQKPYDQGTDAYHKELMTRMDNGEMSDSAKINFPDSLKFYTPNKRVVFGGGGIMPDIFIPMDTSHFSKHFSAILRKGLTSEFTLNYVSNNRTQFEADYADYSTFKANFAKNEKFMDAFDKFIAKHEIDEKGKDDASSREKVENRVKGLIARNLFNTQAYYQVINETDETFLKAVEIIENAKSYKAKIARN